MKRLLFLLVSIFIGCLWYSPVLAEKVIHFPKGDGKLDRNEFRHAISTYYPPNYTLTGPATLNKLLLMTLTIRKGPLQFNHLTVREKAQIDGAVLSSNYGNFGSLNVIGSIIAQHITAQKLRVRGNSNFQYLHVSEDSFVKGAFSVNNGVLRNVFAASSNINLENVNVDNIYVLELRAKDGSMVEQKVQLKGTTIVNGNIEFKSNKGFVEKDRTSKILGKVIGGILKEI